MTAPVLQEKDTGTSAPKERFGTGPIADSPKPSGRPVATGADIQVVAQEVTWDG